MSDKPKKPPQRDPLPFALNVVNSDIPYGEAPESERVDQEKTLAIRRKLSQKGLPRLARSVHEQFSTGGIYLPDEDEARVFGEEARRDRHWRVCGECQNFSYQAGQEFLDNGGAWGIVEAMGGPKESSWLGDWRKYGWCEARQCPCDSQGPKCEFYGEKKKGVFGRILSGTWKRLRDI
jgi:hypothetical protein